MAENDNNENGNTANNLEQAVNQPQGPVFAMQRIYLKDASFESPRSPETFQGQWSPKITFSVLEALKRIIWQACSLDKSPKSVTLN